MNEDDKVVADAYALMAICEWDEYHDREGVLWCYHRRLKRFVRYEWCYVRLAWVFDCFDSPPDDVMPMWYYYERQQFAS